MPVDGKHSQPITAPISNHQGQGSTSIHHLSSFDVPVTSWFLYQWAGRSIDLTIQSGCGVLLAVFHAHTYMHADTFKCRMKDGDVIKKQLTFKLVPGRVRVTDTDTHAHKLIQMLAPVL